MSAREPTTQAEAAALRELDKYLDPAVTGYAHSEEAFMSEALLAAYRAGVRDGGKPPETRVFLPGDPEPGPDVVALLDVDGDVWQRRDDGWDCIVDAGDWNCALAAGPLVDCGPLPDYRTAVDADRERRAVEQAGAR